MTNQQKADEICKRHIFDSNHYDCCMEMAQWKDEQHEKEKQQWIDKACKWLEDKADDYIEEYNGWDGGFDFHQFKMIDDFKKAMEEQL